MRTAEQLVFSANENFVGSYRKLIEHTPGAEIRERSGVFAFATGFPLALFNGCIVAGRVSPMELETAIAWVSGKDLPYSVFIDEGRAPGLHDVPLAHGLEREPAPFPGMVLHPVLEPPPPAEGVEVTPVDVSTLDEYLGVWTEGGMPRELAQRMFSPSIAADQDVQLFTARLDGRPVGTALAIRTGDVSGIYAVSTMPAARRRGVGTAATWAAVGAGRGWGCDVIVLQSTQMGFPVYAAMGFRTVVAYATFTQRSGAAEPG